MPHTEPTQPSATARRFPWRRLLQYRLRTLLIVTTLVAVALGWWSHKARQQRDAVAAIWAADGFVWYDFNPQQPFNIQTPQRPPDWPAWLVDAIGVDYFATVKKVGFWDIFPAPLKRAKVTDNTLKHIQRLPLLEVLDLHNTQTTDAGLEHLRGLTALQRIDLRNTQVTDDGVQRLQRVLPNCTIFH